MTTYGEGASGYVVLSPFHHQPIVALLFQYVVDVVPMATGMLHDEFVARYLGAENSDDQHVVSCESKYRKQK